MLWILLDLDNNLWVPFYLLICKILQNFNQLEHPDIDFDLLSSNINELIKPVLDFLLFVFLR